MPNDCLTFSQGSIATFTAQFVTTPTAMPINVPDPTIEIFGPGGSVILAATTMSGPVVTGLYFYDYVIPNSLPVNTYTVRFSGTVLGTPTAATLMLNVIAGGVPSGHSTGETRAAAALERYIGCAQRIPVEAELGRTNLAKNQIQLQWPRWNLTNAIIRKNDGIIETGFAIDYDIGLLTFGSSILPSDKIDATYNFRFFSQEELVGYLSDALNIMNLEPPGTTFTLDNLPSQYMGVVLHGAAANAIRSMMFCIQFQKQSTIFGGPDRAKDVFSNLNTLKENHEKTFTENKTKAKRTNWPRIAANVSPEFTLPGGRSRWFRYLYSSNVS